MEEIAKGAALLVDPKDHFSIAEEMMRLYKDENLRNELIRKGIVVAEQYSWDRTAKLFWECIVEAAGSEKNHTGRAENAEK
jgi:glycosyltransferase involved in cell wall biosynthesis